MLSQRCVRFVCSGGIAILAAAAAAAEAAGADLVIVQDGQPQATIVIAKDAPDPVRQKRQTAAGKDTAGTGTGAAAGLFNDFPRIDLACGRVDR